ncbi:portal protein, PBSX family [Burkholderia pseudomallei]|nr:portal protein, PBSX family [Burkholderia pseudomallei]
MHQKLPDVARGIAPLVLTVDIVHVPRRIESVPARATLCCFWREASWMHHAVAVERSVDQTAHPRLG